MNILETVKLRKEFGALVAVNDVSLSFQKGQIIGLIGPNGAGKTTLLRMLATLLNPTSGSAEVMGFDLTRDYLQIRKHVGFLSDFFNLYNDLTLVECLRFFGQAYGVNPNELESRINEVLVDVDLIHKKDDFIRKLSRGMLQRLGVAVLMVYSPDIFILDEPASGLDPRARIQLRNNLKKLSKAGKTIIISSHILTELADFCTHVVIMDQGNVKLSGSIEEVQHKMKGVSKIKITVLDDPKCALDLIKNSEIDEVVMVQDNMITLQTSRDQEKIAELNTYLVQQGIRIVNFHEERINIEDVFMQISGDFQDEGVSNVK